MGGQAFAGKVIQGSENHIGPGVLNGELIVGAYLAGYDLRPDHINELVNLARLENTAAHH